MLHAPWTVHTDPNPADPILTGFRIRDARGFVVAEIFHRPYPVVVDRAHADALAASPQMLTALRLAKPVCADAYYDALAVQENPTGDAVNHPAENAQATAAALAAWEAVNAAIALAEGRQPEPLDVPEADAPDATDAGLLRDDPDNGEPYASLARASGYEIDADSSGEKQWMQGPYDPDATSPLYWTAKEVCDAEGLGEITPPTTDEVGAYVRDMLGEGYIDAAEVTGGCRDSIDHTDDSDPSNLRLTMASGAVFVVRIVREG